MRTVVVLGVVGLGSALLLAGCGGGDETPSAAGSSSSSTSAAAPSASASGDAFGPSGTTAAPSGAAATTGVATGGASAPTSAGSAAPLASAKALSTSAWTKAANAACADYAKFAGPGGGGSEPAQVQSRLRDRAWSITGRLRGLPQGTSQTESFITLLYGVGQESDWLIQQYLDPKADTKERNTAEQARDAQLKQWYTQADKLGTDNCADVMKAA